VSKLISHYPDGATGIALLLMRLASALAVLPALLRLWPAPASWWPVLVASAILALALVAGIGTRAGALLLVAALIVGLLTDRAETMLLMLGSAFSAGALALLGPGAWSADAHRFGRRVIRLEPRSPDRGDTG
jgi:O-antigen ligase